ncbi:ABC transporter permease [Rathayibacter sp. VKM Ac-2759]|uniref:ABC transporter permease n=1 Tax=Rathayibacter sp. VKM Ac-2759 TaxID=2609252 RepID=UPI0013161930|nr:ABC transporter permease [Rathayibacter sp. VKM Ac-2759]QHC67177.1 ABC transporter permease [Rathayibacter sp. VKM Ac-2759]
MTSASLRAVSGAAAPRRRRGLPETLGVAPFAVYVLLFLAVPTVLAVGTGFVDGDGRPTLANVAALGDPVVLSAFGASLGLSALTAVVGAVLGAVVCLALLGADPRGPLRTVVDAAASVLAQFGGVMLAFAFIATIGVQGLVTTLLAGAGVDLYADGVWLYQMPGLVLPYLYFQVPLMVLTFLPALEGLRPEWAEANAVLGGGALSYWWRVAVPVLAPSFLGSMLLLFANAFSSFATAAALISQGAQIVPLQIRAALVSETVLGRENLAGALALGMLVVMIVLMSGYALLQRRARRWQR